MLVRNEICENLKMCLQEKIPQAQILLDDIIIYDINNAPLSQELMLELKDEILEQLNLYEPRVKQNDMTLTFKDSILTLHIHTQEENLSIELS